MNSLLTGGALFGMPAGGVAAVSALARDSERQAFWIGGELAILPGYGLGTRL